MIYIFILLYFPTLVLSFVFVRSKTSNIWRIGLFACLASLVIATLFLALLWGEQMGGLFYAAVLLVFSIPIFLLGAGVSLGGGAKVLLHKGRPVFSALILASAIILPGLGFGSSVYNIHKKNARRAAGLIQTQSHTIGYRLGTHDLNLPISPQLKLQHIFQSSRKLRELRHYCSSPKNKTRNHTDCSNLKLYEEVEDKDVSFEPKLSAQFLKNIKLQIPRIDCNSIHSCIKPSEQQAWCERRPDVSGDIWCTNTLNNNLGYERYYPPSDFSAKIETQDWTLHSTLSHAKDSLGKPVEIKCSRRRDNMIAERKENPELIVKGKSLGRYCQIKYRIEKDIEVSANYNVIGPETLVTQAREAYDYSQAFWHDMKTRELQSTQNTPEL